MIIDLSKFNIVLNTSKVTLETIKLGDYSLNPAGSDSFFKIVETP